MSTNVDTLSYKTSLPWIKEVNPLVILSCALLICMVGANAVAYKIVNVFGWSANGAPLLFTFSFPICVLIAEIYGNKMGKLISNIAIISSLCFSLIVVIIIHLPSPASAAQHNDAFKFVLGNSLRFSIVGTIASLLAFRVNIAIVTHFKKLTQGRFFILRYLGSTTFGEFALATIATFGAFLFVVPVSQIVQIWLFSYLFKVTITTILAWPTTVLAIYIKKVSGVDIY